MTHHILGICLALSLVGCATTGQQAVADPPVTPVKLTGAQVAAVQGAVKRKLKDPGSAQFRGIVGGTQPNGRTQVCGWVNAKNSFGGFTGHQPFAATIQPASAGGTIGAVLPNELAYIDAPALMRQCANRNLALTR